MARAVARRLVLLGLGLALAGCSGTPSPTLYTLVAEPGTPIDHKLTPASLRIVEVPNYLARPQIVRRRTAVQLDAADFERWGEEFDEMVTRVLLQDLTQRLPGMPLAIASSAVALRSETAIGVSIARFDPDPDGTVVLEARWTIDRGAKAGAPVQLDRITHPSGEATADLASAMSDCLAVLADHIAAALASA